jgi:hypothetical protein
MWYNGLRGNPLIPLSLSQDRCTPGFILFIERKIMNLADRMANTAINVATEELSAAKEEVLTQIEKTALAGQRELIMYPSSLVKKHITNVLNYLHDEGFVTNYTSAQRNGDTDFMKITF